MDPSKLNRTVLTVLQFLALLGPVAGGAGAQIEGTTNTQDLLFIVVGAVVSAASLWLNRANTTPLSDPQLDNGTPLGPVG